MKSLNKTDLKELLTKNWMTHDGMWFYHCGIFERFKGWLEGLGIEYSVTPQVDGCMMHTDGKCFRDFKLKFS